MLHVGVVVPSWHYWFNPVKLQPLWELYYATFIDEHVPGTDVCLVDMRGQDVPVSEQPIPEKDVYFYWIMKSADSVEIYETVKRIRVMYPKAVHIAGGTHVDHHLTECSEIFDAAISGTAEAQIIQAFAGLQSGELLSVYRQDALQPFCEFGHARRDFLPTERVVNNLHFQEYGGVAGTGVYFSRGCGFKCSFCVYNNPPKFEYRTPEQITAEIEYLKENYGVRGVNLRDEVCIPVNPKLSRGYLEAIGKAGVIWRGQTVPFGTEEMVKLAAEAGCKELALGIESADSDLVLEISNKPSKSIENNKKYIELLKSYGIRVKVCMILGLPGESRHVLERTVKFLEEVEPAYVAVSGFDPVPGSPFYMNPEKYGIKRIDHNLEKHAHLLYRHGEDEDVGLPFEYEKEGPWGTTLSRNEIIDNIKSLQSWLRDRSMAY